MKFFAALLSITILSACTGGTYKDYLRMHDIAVPTTDNFTHCYDYGCQTKVMMSLPIETKEKLQSLFTPPADTAENERQKMATAIEIFEKDIGDIVGTKNDKRGTFRLYQDDAESTKSFQQDCVDESTNTTVYVALLEEMTLLKFHQIDFPTSRQPFLGGAPWWHQTAVIKETQTGEKYALDSWFHDNAHPAFVVPYQEWKDGWLPPKIKPDKGSVGNSE